MTQIQHQINSSGTLTKVVAILVDLPWVEILADAWQLARKVIRGLTNEGMVEILEYESTLELLDAQGKRAFFKKRMLVRYLQDNITTFQDYGWGDGVMSNYRAAPGHPVDQYKSGHRKYILLSLRGVRNRGDQDEFHISWTIRDGFLKPDGFWETSVSNRMRNMRINVIFPEARRPVRVYLEETNRRRMTRLDDRHLKQLPDGHWKASWVNDKPALFEHYILRWDW